MKLTIKQRKFADEYIICGNATQAAIKAGYSKKTAYQIGSANLQKQPIKTYIEKRLKEINDKKTMSLEEAIRVTSSIARGEVQEGRSRQRDNITGEIVKDVSYFFTPSIEERQKSLEHIIRCNGGFVDKQEVDMDMDLRVEVDYGD